jgi:hypothetical protein
VAQVRDVIDKVNRQLLSGTVEERNKIASALTTTSTSITLTYAPEGIRKGSLIEINGEQMYVWDVAIPTRVLTVERGYGATDAVPHAANSIVINNPRFPRNQILEAINDELADLSSPVNGLFQMKTTEVQWNGSDRMVNLPGVYEIQDLYSVHYRYLSDDYPRLWKVRLLRNMPSNDFPSGYALVIDDYIARTGTLLVSYKAPFDSINSESDDIEVTAGLSSTAVDLLVLGAQIRMMAPREIKRNFTESQGDTRRAEEVPAGAVAGSLANLLRLRRDRIVAEAMRLNRQYPTFVKR